LGFNLLYMQKYIKVSVEKMIPTEEGKYIVFTKTQMGNINVIEVSFHSTVKNDVVIPHWGCNNQIVTHWLVPHLRHLKK